MILNGSHLNNGEINILVELVKGNLTVEEHSSRQQEEMLQSGWGIFTVTDGDFEKCEGQKK